MKLSQLLVQRHLTKSLQSRMLFSSSVRDKELKFYEKLDDWWSPTGPQGQLHKFNKVRVNFIRKNILNDVKPAETQEQLFGKMKVLDIGCGAGLLSESLGRIGMGSVTGIDPTHKSETHLNLDQELAKRVQYKNTTIESLIEEKLSLHRVKSVDQLKNDELYDVVCLSEVIEHASNQEEFLKTCIKLVKPETGYFFMSTIAKTPESYFLTILMAEHIMRIGSQKIDNQLYNCFYLYIYFIEYINPEDIENILGPQGYRTVAKAGAMITNPITFEMDEFPNWLRGNYMMLFKRLM